MDCVVSRSMVCFELSLSAWLVACLLWDEGTREKREGLDGERFEWPGEREDEYGDGCVC
jgi:hypothetical protein